MALLLVLGASTVMLIIGATLAGQARQELRMSQAVVQAAAIQAAVDGAFNEAAVNAERDAAFPGAEQITEDNGYCSPAPAYSGAPYPWVCRQVLPARSVMTQPLGDVTQWPVRVVWQVAPGGDLQATYGWILTDPTQPDPDTGLPIVLGVWYAHNWCAPYPDFSLRTCKMGG